MVKMTNLFKKIIKKEESSEEIEVSEGDTGTDYVEGVLKDTVVDVESEKEDEQESFEIKPGDLLPEIPKPTRKDKENEKEGRRKRRFSLKVILYLTFLLVLMLLVLSLLTANSNLANANENELYLVQNSLNVCVDQQSALESQVSLLKAKDTQEVVCPEARCSIEDCNIYTNTYNLTENPNLVASLKRRINHLENLTSMCFNMNESNKTMQNELRQCRLRLNRIIDIGEEE